MVDKEQLNSKDRLAVARMKGCKDDKEKGKVAEKKGDAVKTVKVQTEDEALRQEAEAL
ncbi:hypothetical protein PQX77_007762 [Marasmius sp. AFHP31]|nr:hypothetical protein PQX77_007762 [Marasmius sp. AFHP31]